MMEDKVNHPSHYTQGGIETIDFIEAKNMTYHEANIIKYVVRWRDKGGLEDLHKAKWYLQRLIEISQPCDDHLVADDEDDWSWANTSKPIYIHGHANKISKNKDGSYSITPMNATWDKPVFPVDVLANDIETLSVSGRRVPGTFPPGHPYTKGGKCDPCKRTDCTHDKG
jgi:hypothetical protein